MQVHFVAGCMVAVLSASVVLAPTQKIVTTPQEKTQLPAGAGQDWWGKVQQDLKQREYHITWQEKTCIEGLAAAYQAPNRRQDLRTYFTPEGIHVVRRTETTPSWQWGSQVSGYGYSGDIQPAAKATLDVKDNRIEYKRDNLTEWYVNTEQGLEQGFTVT
jgi:hypothetical protein